MHAHFIIILSTIHKYYILCSNGIYHNLSFLKYRYYLSNKVAPVARFKKKKQLRMVIVNTSLIQETLIRRCQELFIQFSFLTTTSSLQIKKLRLRLRLSNLPKVTSWMWRNLEYRPLFGRLRTTCSACPKMPSPQSITRRKQRK